MTKTIVKEIPEYCYSELKSTGELIILQKGTRGYYPCDYDGTADMHNERIGVSKGQRMAMDIGSMAGWDVKGAQPSTWYEDGTLVEKE